MGHGDRVRSGQGEVCVPTHREAAGTGISDGPLLVGLPSPQSMLAV